jgi:hypothetical protein
LQGWVNQLAWLAILYSSLYRKYRNAILAVVEVLMVFQTLDAINFIQAMGPGPSHRTSLQLQSWWTPP